MPRIDRRRLRTGLRLGLPDDPVSSRGYATALRVQLAGASTVLVGGLIVPNVSRSHRFTLSVLLGVLVASILILMATVGRANPRRAWCVVTVLEAATILFGTLLVPEIFVPGLIAYTIVVAATTAIGGLGIGLLVSLIAAVAAVIGDARSRPGAPRRWRSPADSR